MTTLKAGFRVIPRSHNRGGGFFTCLVEPISKNLVLMSMVLMGSIVQAQAQKPIEYRGAGDHLFCEYSAGSCVKEFSDWILIRANVMPLFSGPTISARWSALAKSRSRSRKNLHRLLKNKMHQIFHLRKSGPVVKLICR